MSARSDFVSKYNNYVQQITKGTGIFPETVFAQAIIESQENDQIPGTELAKNYNNFFGIKDSADWTGQVVNLSTHEVYNGQTDTETDGFRVYATPQDSFLDYVNFLQNNSRYQSAGVFDATNVQDQATALQNAGYATNPNYATLITSVANSISSYITPLNVAIGIGLLILMIGALYISTNHE
jgi:flagellum-specific peptidoglycan hydrolase FlgJ